MVLSSHDRGDVITPSYLRWLYNTFAYVPIATDENVQAVS